MDAEVKLPTPVQVWGLPLVPLTLARAKDVIDDWIAERTPRYVITANVHYAMLLSRDQRLAAVTQGAAAVFADGMPLVWAARGQLPERVTGSDLAPALCARAAERGYRIFLLGAAPGVAEEAAANLRVRFPGINVVGTLAPPFRDWSPQERFEINAAIRDARPDLLFVAFGQPKGEVWVAENYQDLNVPVTIQIGATLDFLAGRVPRAPRWIQRIGLEWAYRMLQEPRRLMGRYFQNGLFVAKMLMRRHA